MKREHTNQENFSSSGSCSSSGKAKMWSCEAEDAGVDELFAVLGYKVKSSDMAEVAQKIEQLEEVMGSVQQDGLSQLASETVHYNPSDLSSWLESMISGLNPMPEFDSSSDPFLESSTITTIDNGSSVNSRAQMVADSDFGSDLISIPGKAIYPRTQPPAPPPLTGIGPPSNDNTDHLQEVGWKLAKFAETINVEFEYRGFVATSLADLNAAMFDIREGETVAVNSIFELHQLLARPGAIEKVLQVVRELKPEILTVVEQEANHNGNVFLERFTESLHYYSTLFDSLESCGAGNCDALVSDQDKVMSEVYLGRQICNVVACEGVDRIERHETLTQWRVRFGSAGFGPVHLGSNAYKQASMLLALFAGGDGYRVEENNGCLMLGWHTRTLIATSAWKLS
ncbi:hypothetical protein CDL12_05562 [Handroanthus impetiginosus]|uniref:DELLA protein n=1 Tax=Handroanthus impetiginosus TaxID=429701 RepID=A0A2G9HW67_9LAMI|nr:hypothetical protein CDL12_05562 [Handroanthus impetiginosus]